MSDWRKFNVAEFEKWFSQFFAGSPKFGVILIGGSMGEVTVPDSSAPLNATVTFLDAKGAQTVPDQTPTWSSTDESVATVDPSNDGMSATINVGMPGASVIEVSTVESNTGDTIIAQGTVTVQPGDTVIGSVEFTTPVESTTPTTEETGPTNADDVTPA